MVFVGAVTYTATQYVTVDWGPAPCDVPGVGALVAGAAVVPAALRRRLPVVALLAAAALFGWYPATGIALALASYSVAARVRRTRWRDGVVTVAAVLPFTIGLIGSGYQWEVVIIEFGIAALVTVAGPVAVQTLLAQREQLIGALREQSRYAGSTARLQERSRIAQEMHDLLGHRLSLISLYAGSLEMDATRHVSEPARLIRTTVRTAMDELRATLGILRQAEPAATRPADHTGTRADIFQLVRQAQAGGVEVTLHWSGDDLSDVARPVRQAVHRIVREGLTNVCRHAPGSRTEVEQSRETQAQATQPKRAAPQFACEPQDSQGNRVGGRTHRSRHCSRGTRGHPRTGTAQPAPARQDLQLAVQSARAIHHLQIADRRGAGHRGGRAAYESDVPALPSHGAGQPQDQRRDQSSGPQRPV